MASLRRSAPIEDAAEARAAALRFLARREHSRAELRTKLLRKGCPESIADEVVGRLESERLLSEDRFVEGLIAARRRRGYGPVRIREALREKGVSAGTIEQWLDAGSREWLEEARAARRKKFGARMPGSFSERARQARFLQYRGFTTEQIQQALNAHDTD